MKYFWKKAYATITGKASIAAAASFTPSWDSALPPTANKVINWGMVIRCSSLMTIIGHSTSFHEDINVIIPTVIMAGRELGHNILNKIVNSLQPSIRSEERPVG